MTLGHRQTDGRGLHISPSFLIHKERLQTLHCPHTACEFAIILTINTDVFHIEYSLTGLPVGTTLRSL